MAKLILSMDGLVLKEIPLVKERTTIGRKVPVFFIMWRRGPTVVEGVWINLGF